MYSEASNLVTSTDNAFLFIIGISILFLVGISGTILWFIYRFNNKKNPVATQIHGNNTLEIIWTIIPFILVMFMFFYGWNGYSPAKKAPEDALRIKAVSRMWSWSFEYPNGAKTDTLYIPVDKAVVLDLISVDVVHSLYIPAFRIKEDMVPGRTNRMWFVGKKIGNYELFCAEYCGLSHSYMFTEVVVMEPKNYENYMATLTDTAALAQLAADPAAAGRRVIEQNGCLACHSTDGTKLIGPTFKGVYNHEVSVTADGQNKKVLADDEYIKRSIYEPDAEVVEGFVKGQMQSYKNQLNDDQVNQIIEYLKSLN